MTKRIFSPKFMLWSITGIGVLIPVLTGLLVKLLLMGEGEETIPFFRIVFLLPLLLYWGLPFIMLALFAFAYLSWAEERGGLLYSERIVVLTSGTLFGAISSILVFWSGWQASGDLMLMAAPFWVGTAILVGLGCRSFENVRQQHALPRKHFLESTLTFAKSALPRENY